MMSFILNLFSGSGSASGSTDAMVDAMVDAGSINMLSTVLDLLKFLFALIAKIWANRQVYRELIIAKWADRRRISHCIKSIFTQPKLPTITIIWTQIQVCFEEPVKPKHWTEKYPFLLPLIIASALIVVCAIAVHPAQAMAAAEAEMKAAIIDKLEACLEKKKQRATQKTKIMRTLEAHFEPKIAAYEAHVAYVATLKAASATLKATLKQKKEARSKQIKQKMEEFEATIQENKERKERMALEKEEANAKKKDYVNQRLRAFAKSTEAERKARLDKMMKSEAIKTFADKSKAQGEKWSQDFAKNLQRSKQPKPGNIWTDLDPNMTRLIDSWKQYQC